MDQYRLTSYIPGNGGFSIATQFSNQQEYKIRALTIQCDQLANQVAQVDMAISQLKKLHGQLKARLTVDKAAWRTMNEENKTGQQAIIEYDRQMQQVVRQVRQEGMQEEARNQVEQAPG